MEEFFHYATKILSHNIVVHIYSIPNFTIESFIYGLMCIVHFLLIMEVNSTVSGVVEKSLEKFKRTKSIKDQEKISSIVSADSAKIHHHLKKYYENRPCFSMSYQKKMSTFGPNGWVFPNSVDERYDKIDQILSVTPSEFIRRDKERKVQENELTTCLKSLTSLLQSNEGKNFSDPSLQKNIELLKTQLRNSESVNDLRTLKKETTENLYELMEESLLQSITKGSMTYEVNSHGDVMRMDEKTNTDLKAPHVRVVNSGSNTSFEIDSQFLNVESKITIN